MEMADGDRFTPEQAEALRALRDGRNVFLSGNAGTGKSYVLNAFISDLKARNVDFLALAPTGIAALNLTDVSTIHRTLKIAPGVCAPDGPKGSRKVLDAAKVIIIDEISMCRIDLFDHVMGMISQSMTRNGAKQVVLVGDFFQLPPVVTERDSALLMKFYPGNLQGLVLQVEVLDRLRFRAARPQEGRAPIRPRFHRQPEPRPRRRRVVPRLLQRALEELPRLPAEGHAGAVRQQPHRRFDQPRERRRARRTEGRVRGRRDRHGVKR